MRVGLVIYGSLDTVSGGYLYDRQLVRYLRQAGDEVDILSLPWRNYAGHLADNFSRTVRRRLGGDYDVILQDELNHPSLAFLNGRLQQKAPRVTIVHHLRSSEARPDWQNRFYRLIEKKYLRSVDAYIFNSQTTRRAVDQLAGLGKPYVIAYPGGDRFESSVTTEMAKRRARTGPLRLLFVGNLIPRKGLHTLLEALARLKAVEWRLHIVGNMRLDPAYARRIYNLLDQNTMEKRIVWRGSLKDADLAKELAAAHVMVVPSSYEGFGIAYLEGMGFGLPAVATTAGAAGEFITDGENGCLVPPEDAASLSSCLANLANDRERLARMSVCALDRYAAHPTWEQSAAAIRDFLLTLIA